MKRSYFITAALVAVVGGVAVVSHKINSKTFNQAFVERHCSELIKNKLNDPDSYRLEKAKVHSQYGSQKQHGVATVEFRARNGFGGYAKGVARCSSWSVGKTTHLTAVIR